MPILQPRPSAAGGTAAAPACCAQAATCMLKRCLALRLSPFASISLPAAETLEAVRLCMNRCLLGGGRWDYQRMSRLLDAPELAAVLSEADPFKPSTEDKLEVGWCLWQCCC